MSAPVAVPQLVHTRAKIREIRAAWGQCRVGLVPTMGALHAGHAELIRRARADCERVVVSIFVNPLQFAADEDLDRYPTTLTADRELCTGLGVDLIFAPTAGEMYPQRRPVVSLDAGPLGQVLEGQSRAGHFSGVLTVVAKLFLLGQPSCAFFGEKDAQQLLLIQKMVADLEFPTQIIPVPTIRDDDGLALSSRNQYLSAAERTAARAIPLALQAADRSVHRGPGQVRRLVEEELRAAPGIEVDYIALVDPTTLRPVAGSGPALLAVAATVGHTRLIDNIRLTFGSQATGMAEKNGETHG